MYSFIYELKRSHYEEGATVIAGSCKDVYLKVTNNSTRKHCPVQHFHYSLLTNENKSTEASLKSTNSILDDLVLPIMLHICVE